eukprot:632460-Hanusia_phi.AAC.7
MKSEGRRAGGLGDMEEGMKEEEEAERKERGGEMGTGSQICRRGKEEMVVEWQYKDRGVKRRTEGEDGSEQEAGNRFEVDACDQSSKLCHGCLLGALVCIGREALRTCSGKREAEQLTWLGISFFEDLFLVQINNCAHERSLNHRYAEEIRTESHTGWRGVDQKLLQVTTRFDELYSKSPTPKVLLSRLSGMEAAREENEALSPSITRAKAMSNMLSPREEVSLAVERLRLDSSNYSSPRSR